MRGGNEIWSTSDDAYACLNGFYDDEQFSPFHSPAGSVHRVEFTWIPYGTYVWKLFLKLVMMICGTT